MSGSRFAPLALAFLAGCVGRGEASAAGSDASPSPGAHAASVAPTAASSNGSRPAEKDPGLCAAICARSEALHCREAASCVRRCESMRSMSACQAEVRASLDCFASTPASVWICNDHGLPSVKDGVCDQEQGRAAKCLSAIPLPGTR
jgi:hypothetical protein